MSSSTTTQAFGTATLEQQREAARRSAESFEAARRASGRAALEAHLATLPPLHDTFKFVKDDGEWVVEHPGGNGSASHKGRIVVIRRRDGGDAYLLLGNQYTRGRRTFYYIRNSYDDEQDAVDCGACAPTPARRTTTATDVRTVDEPRPAGRMVLH